MSLPGLVKNRYIAIAIVTFAALTYLFAWSPVFSVKTISTVGAPREVSAQSIIEKTEIEIGEKLSRIEPRSIERSLRELSWIQSASVNRNWLKGIVTISLTPRIPVGIYQGQAIDKTGALFQLPGAAPKGLPVVTASSPALGLEAIALFTNLPFEIRESTISVSARNENAISSWQQLGERKLKITWGSSRDIDLKVTVMQALLELPENKAIKRVDLSAPHAPIVK